MISKKQNTVLKRGFNFFQDFKLEELLNIIRFGLPVKRGMIIQIRKDNFSGLPEPVFFMSTGRCGTQWFAKLLSKGKKTMVFHEPKPNFDSQGKKLYQLFIKHNFDLPDTIQEAYKEVFMTGRERYLRYSYKTEKRFIETNNHLTFFAPIINSVLPSVKFVHLIRHPGDFVRSAIRRRFYSDSNIRIQKRIVPVSGPHLEQWNNYDSVEKNSWLWNATNNFIENFKNVSKSKNIYTFNFNTLSVDKIEALLNFLELSISKKNIKKLLHVKVNVQKGGKYKQYADWSQHDKNKLIKICGSLAKKYNYNLK
ncbi:MAG: sulfotransferase [bacterium]